MVCYLLGILMWAWADKIALAAEPMWINIPAGSYTPLFIPSTADLNATLELNTNRQRDLAATVVRVSRFKLQTMPVSNEDFLSFVTTNSNWRQDKVKRIFADANYLRHWLGPLDIGDKAALKEPVVNVSWFAAKSYCELLRSRLPTTDEWEYVASLDEPEQRNATILEWYSHPASGEKGHSTNSFIGRLGVVNMYGKIWEWTLDFNSSLVTGEAREEGSLSPSMFCGAGSINSSKPEEYATFMRFAFRNSLKGNYTLPTLGFRCASDWEG